MVGRRNREIVIRMFRDPQDVPRLFLHLLHYRFIETPCPVGTGVSGVPVYSPQIVDHVPARNDQDISLTHCGELPGEFDVVRKRLLGIYRKLDDRNIRVREQVLQHAPCPVVEAPLIEIFDNPGRLNKFLDLPRKFRKALGRILNLEEFFRKSVKIVDRAVTRHRCNSGRAYEPVG